jgi:hypothetical protein
MGRVVPLFHLFASIGMLRGDLCLYIIMCNLFLFSIFVSSYCTAAANCMKASSSEGRIKSWDDATDRMLHSKMASLIYFPILLRCGASNVRFHRHILEFSLSDSRWLFYPVGFSCPLLWNATYFLFAQNPWKCEVAHFSPRLHESLLGVLSHVMNCTLLFPEIHKQIWRFKSAVSVDPVESSEGLKAMKPSLCNFVLFNDGLHIVSFYFWCFTSK